MIAELYINSKMADIEGVDIVRLYTSPFFSDATKLRSDTTLTVRLPRTVANEAIFKHCLREDSISDVPYDILSADYYYEGLPIFLKAEVKMLPSNGQYIEIQCVYGLDREKFLPLFEKKLNEIVPDDNLVRKNDWLINWSHPAMFVNTGKYSYHNYYSGERKRDVETSSDGIILTLTPDPTIRFHMKFMTQHPFVLAENVLEMINSYNGLDIDFADITDKLSKTGHILSGNKVNVTNAVEGHINIFNVGTADVRVFVDTIIGAKAFPFILHNGGSGNRFILRIDKYAFGNILPMKIRLRADFRLNRQFGVNVIKTLNGVSASLGSFHYDSDILFDGFYTYKSVVDFTLTEEDINAIITFECSGGAVNYIFDSAFVNRFYCKTLELNSCYYSIGNDGYYDCIANLPAISHMEYISQWAIQTGVFIGYDKYTNRMRTFSLDRFMENINNDYIYDWSGRVSNAIKCEFQFNSNAQKNYIKYGNDDKLTDRKAIITVNDKTIEKEKDLHVLFMDSPLGGEGLRCNMILYEQNVKRSGTTGVMFENNYKGGEYNLGICKIDESGQNLINKNIVEGNYAVYQMLIQRPQVIEFEVNLGIYESAYIDFEKPIYIQDFGRYCLLLELQAPNDDVCVARVLLINQTL